MELIAGDAREILVVLGASEIGVTQGTDRYHAHLPMTGAIDPTWLDMFAEAARAAHDTATPVDFIDARLELGGAGEGALTVERVDPSWVSAVARLPDRSIDAIAGRWIDRLEDEMGPISSEEKPWIRELAVQLVAFCRAADREPDVVFVWSLR
jgi:hypothetical protein